MTPCSAQIFGPFVYGLTYAKTVATYPKTIIAMAASAVMVSCVLLAFVRLPAEPAKGGDVEEQAAPAPVHPEREETLVGDGQPLIVIEDEESGRQVVKP